MQDLNDKITGNTLSASEWNQVPSEIQNVIEGLGITLSGADLNQLGKAVAGYVSNGVFYADSGLVNAYVLSSIGSKQTPPSYTDGFITSFVTANANTGASTLNVGGLGVKNIKLSNGDDPAVNDISGRVYVQYDLANDRFELLTPKVTNRIIIKNTVSEMTSDTSLVAGMTVSVLDYTTSRNSGVLHFKVVSGAAPSPDGGKQIDHDTLSVYFEQNLPIYPSVKMWGVTGDGTTDDTTASQAAIDYMITQGGGTLIWPTGTYIITSLDVRHGLEFIGQANTVIKRPASQPNWTRTFTTQNDLWDDDEDSPPLVFRNMIFDGNRVNQGTYTGFELEQAHLLFVMADTIQKGRLRVIIDGCIFKENVADGVSIFKNTDITISNCYFDNLFRGGIVLTGGWTKLRATTCRIGGDVHKSGIDIEVDNAGYDSSFSCDVEMGEIDCDGDFDVSLRDSSVFLGTNINALGEPFVFNGRESKMRISNSRFNAGVLSSVTNRIVRPNDMQFDNCEFIVTEDNDTGDQSFVCAHVYWQSSSTDTDQRLVFNNCKLGVDSTIEAGDTTYGIYCEADTDSRDNRLITNDCEFGSGLDYGIYVTQGGNIYTSNNTYDCTTAVYTSGNNAGGQNINYYADGMKVTSNVATYHEINNSNAGFTYQYTNSTLDEAQNVIATTFGITSNVYQGGRTILGAAAPGSEPGLVGDIFQLKTAVAGSTYQWVCTVSSETSATWKALTAAAA